MRLTSLTINIIKLEADELKVEVELGDGTEGEKAAEGTEEVGVGEERGKGYKEEKGEEEEGRMGGDELGVGERDEAGQVQVLGQCRAGLGKGAGAVAVA